MFILINLDLRTKRLKKAKLKNIFKNLRKPISNKPKKYKKNKIKHIKQ
jgi:hypothetical protein